MDAEIITKVALQQSSSPQLEGITVAEVNKKTAKALCLQQCVSHTALPSDNVFCILLYFCKHNTNTFWEELTFNR